MENSSDHPVAAEEERPVATFHPSVWGDHFITNPPMPPKELESLKLQEDELKEEVRNMIKGAADTLKSLELIDRIQRLGVAYHFEDEINSELHRIHGKGLDRNDLYTVALHFRLLRQHRYHISCDVFERFLNDEGEFKDSSCNDVKSLLSLYEAAHLFLPGEEILDKAKKFTKKQLIDESLSKLEPQLAMMVNSALELPLIRRVDRPRTKLYLSIYEKENGFNKVLLKFAKLDFNILQALYREEARSLSIWWKNLGFSKTIPFARDRMIEGFFWIVSLFHEPCYARARAMATKIFALLSITDDIYDTYGTIEELKLFTDIIKSWDLEGVSKLPNYMQQCFLTTDQTFKEFEEELAPQNYSFRVKYLMEEFKKMAPEYLEEAKWASESYIPKLKDHFKVSLITAGYSYISCSSIIGMEDVITDDFFQWLSSRPPFMIAINLIGRVMNDVVSYEFEQNRKHVAATVQSYMMEYGCSKEEACEKLMDMVEDSLKIINRDFLFSKNIPMALLQPIINMVNFTALVYKDHDDYTDSSLAMKDYITAMLIEPIHIDL